MMRFKNLGRLWMAAMIVAASVNTASAGVGLVDAVKALDRSAVRAFLNQRVDVNAAEVDGTTALHWAAYEDDSEIAELLIRAGANVKAVNRYGVTPLWSACVNGNAAIIEMLLKAGADANTASPEGETALMTAARTGIADAVKVLLAHGADVNAKEQWRGQTALMWASAEGHKDVIQTLFEHGADISARSKGGFTALLLAAREGKIESVRVLLEAGANLNESLQNGSGKQQPNLNTFLLAARNAHYELASFLLDRGADPNAAPLGWTALHQVSWVRKSGAAGTDDPPPTGSGNMDSLEFVRKLVEHGADVNARATKRPPAGTTGLNMIGGTPFLLAARTADVPLMRLLVELGADPNLPNEDKTTPLMVAAGIGTRFPGEDPGTEPEILEAVQMAVDLGGDPNAVDNNGETAMHGAAYKFAPSTVRYLAAAGAKVEIWNQKNKVCHVRNVEKVDCGWTPLTIATGIPRGVMGSIVMSPPTEAALKEAINAAKGAQ